MFAKWIKCTQKYAAEGKASKIQVERLCDDPDFYGFTPKCNHTLLHYNGVFPYYRGFPFCNGPKEIPEEVRYNKYYQWLNK